MPVLENYLMNVINQLDHIPNRALDARPSAQGGKRMNAKVKAKCGTKKRRGKQVVSDHLPKRLYSLPEAAHYLGRTIWSMRELIWRGSIPIVREGKRIFVDIADMDAYVEKHKTTYL